jgi:hypothetical protein
MLTFVQRSINATTIRTASLFESLEVGRPYPLLGIELLNMQENPIVLLKLQNPDGSHSAVALVTECYHVFTLRYIIDTQEGRLYSRVVYRSICVVKGAALLDVMR